MLTVGSLCSGIGGLELGVERALGARTVWHAELDRHASTVLAHHWPGVPNHGDLTTTDWTTVEPVDVMCFGFPCQDISSAGRRAGIKGAKSALWFACAHAVRLVRPRHLLVENVAALLVRGVDRVVADLAEMGYVGRWGCLRSSDTGAPHRRDRFFLAATDTQRRPGGEPHRHPVVGRRTEHPEQAGVGRGCSPTDTRGPGAGRDTRGLPRPAQGARRPGTDLRPAVDGRATPADADVEGWEGFGSAVEDGRAELAERPAANPQDHGRAGSGGTWRGGTGPADGGDAAADAPHGEPDQPYGGDPGRLPVGAVAGTGDRDSRGSAPEGVRDLGRTAGVLAWGPYEAAVARWAAIHGPPPQPRDDRGRLNPALPEWMLGYPAGWVTDIPIPRTAQLRVLGNSVQPQVAEAAARLLLAPLLDLDARGVA